MSQQMEVDQRYGDWMQTYTGRQFWPLDPRPEDFDIKDIAHGLAMICRFGGHSREHYSVAQHSVLVASICPPGFKLAGLMHDAAEAYLGDLIRPLKRTEFGAVYKEAERVVEVALVRWCGLDHLVTHDRGAPRVAWPDEVHHADNVALATEARDVMAAHPAPWVAMPDPHPMRISYRSPHYAEQEFFATWMALRGS